MYKPSANQFPFDNKISKQSTEQTGFIEVDYNIRTGLFIFMMYRGLSGDLKQDIYSSR